MRFERDDCLNIFIEDNGPGFALDLIDKITEPYITTKKRGTGLGLSIVKRIIIDHNAQIFFENLNIQLRPKPKTLLIFPGNEKYQHGVRPVSEGPIRYVLVGFIKEKDHYLKNKY